ncbi:tetratricopeptide repeat protein [Streptomyces sp. NBC_00341]|uniref:caspase, EACC1-associated type n=1 Tax=Streptomyces sp. NBC_00341 TaxID=2975717 RepID=UPI00308B6ECA|nr:tetratricopeptide repeat protein [Streptomyces sp. NBC_00341]
MSGRGIDPARSRIVLLGSAAYEDEQLADVPQITANLRDLAAVLTDPGLGGFPAEVCVTVPPGATGREIGQVLHRAADEAEDLLLFYFAGHGIPLGRSHELYLALHDTAMDAVEYSALRFDTVRGTFLGSRARNRVIILDSCFSGRAIGTTLSAGQQEVLGQLDIRGTYTLASAPPNSTALVLPDEAHTAFTGRLLALLREGAPHTGPLITMQDIYRTLWSRFTAERLPLPQQRGTENADQLGLVLNRTAATGEPPTGRDLPPLPPLPPHPPDPSAESLARRYEQAVELHADGRADEATAVYKEVAEARARVLGPDHPDTLVALDDLAAAYGDAGRAQEALRLGERVAEARTRVLGPEHPHTLETLDNLAASYDDVGRTQEALRLREWLAEARTRVLGPDHPDTLEMLDIIAASYGAMGRLFDAAELEERGIQARTRVLGPENPDTLASVHNHAITYSLLGLHKEAAAMRERVAQARTRVLGAENPDTLATFHDLAASYSSLGRDRQAVDLEEWVAAARSRVLGPEDPDTLETLHDLADFYSRVGRDQDAVALGERVVEARTRLLGPEDPETLEALDLLADFYSALGRDREAQATEKRAADARARVGTS